MAENKTVILSAGGTAGHLFPAHALAADLMTRGWRVLLITDVRGMRFQGASNVPAQCISSATPGGGPIGKVKALIQIGIGILQSWQILRREKPSIVVGFGGYPSFPAVWTAQKIGLPTLLHEQNGALGKANLWLAPKAVKIALSMAETMGISNRDYSKSVVTGNPIRADFLQKREVPYAAANNDEPFEIFITGGSQGAGIFSQVVPAACAQLPAPLKQRLRIVQQCRVEDVENVRQSYASSDIKAEIDTFFADMPERLSKCHLFIGRAGATTVAEIAILGRPAIFVPLMSHADQQQKRNAQALVDAGAAWMMMQEEFKPEALAKRLKILMEDPKGLQQAAASAKTLGRPDAAKKLADAVLCAAHIKEAV